MALDPESRERAGDSPPSVLPVGVLGVNLWAVGLALPLAMSGPVEPLPAAALLGAPLLALIAGAATHARRPTAARWLLLAAFPAAVGLAVALLGHLAPEPFVSPFGTVLASVSLLAYGAWAAWIDHRPTFPLPSTSRPLYGVTDGPETLSRARRRRLLLAAGAVGASSLAVLAPSLADPASMAGAWGDGAPAGATLVAVVGGALGVIALTRFVGPSTRLLRASLPSRRASAWRAAALVALAGVGASAYLALGGG